MLADERLFGARPEFIQVPANAQRDFLRIQDLAGIDRRTRRCTRGKEKHGQDDCNTHVKLPFGHPKPVHIGAKPLRVWRVSKWRLAALVLALAAFVFLSGIQSWPDQLHGMRLVNQQDELYRYVAQELAEPALCDEIPWSAESPGGFFIAPSYERSNCYAFIAGRTKNLGLCWKVKRLGGFSASVTTDIHVVFLGDARRGDPVRAERGP